MTVANVASIYGVSVHTDADGAAVTVGAIVEQSISMGNTIRSEPTSGELYPRYQAIVKHIPNAQITSLNVAAAIDACGLLGKKITAVTNTGVTLYAYFWDDAVGRKSGANHRKYNIKKGLIIPRTLTVDHDGDARIGYQFLPITDGTNDPLVETDSVAVVVQADGERFAIGPMTIGSITIDQIQSFEIDFGINANLLAADSDLFATFAGIATIQPSIAIRGIDPKLLAAAKIPRVGQVGTHANTSFYLRKRTEGGAGFVAKLTAEHIKFTAAGLAYVDNAMSGSGGDPAESSLIMPLRYDGTNDPITVDTTSTHP